MSQGRKSEQEGLEQVVDFGEARAHKIDEKRRKTERIFFQQLLNVYCMTENTECRAVELVEVSEEGCSFQIIFDGKNPWPNDVAAPLSLRLYFSQDTYLPIHLKIQNSRPCIDQGSRYNRYGCSIDKTMSSYNAYLQFIRFLKLYSEHAHKDNGQTTLFYL